MSNVVSARSQNVEQDLTDCEMSPESFEIHRPFSTTWLRTKEKVRAVGIALSLKTG